MRKAAAALAELDAALGALVRFDARPAVFDGDMRHVHPLVTDVEFSFYLHLEVADRPGVLAQVAEILGMQEVSIKSVVQKGLGDDARLVMVMHPVLESRFRAAVELIGGLDFLRSKPRVLRVIEEHFEVAA